VPKITKKLNENSQRLFQKENTFMIIFQKYCKEWQLVLMFLPVILCLAIFHYVPIYGVIIAFKDYKIIQGILALVYYDII
jgi:ABC-type polysaccharide transport system permease subunit